MKERLDGFIKHPKKALFNLALPMIVGMLVQGLYNIVDTAYIGRIGAEAIAALTFSFPLFFVLIALNSGISVGMNSKISRLLGAHRKEEAENTAMHGLLISVIISVIIFIFGVSFLKPLFLLFGAEENVLRLAVGYMGITLSGVIFMFPAFLIAGIFSAQGDTKIPMKIQIIGLFLNTILDPIFIYWLGYGVNGAAIATVISFFAGFVLSIYYLFKKSYLRIHPKLFRFSFKIVKDIFLVGTPAAFTMLLMSFYIIFLNGFMAHFGTEYVAAFGLASRLESVAIMPVVAFSMATLTLTGMFFGAKKYHLLKEITSFSIKISIIFTSIVGLIFFIAPSLFLRIFSSDITLLAIGSDYMRINVFTFPFMAVGNIISRTMQGLGFGMPGFVINIVRIFVIAVPLAYLFVFMLNYNYLSIAIAMILGGLASTVLALVWLFVVLKKVHLLNHNLD